MPIPHDCRATLPDGLLAPARRVPATRGAGQHLCPSRCSRPPRSRPMVRGSRTTWPGRLGGPQREPARARRARPRLPRARGVTPRTNGGRARAAAQGLHAPAGPAGRDLCAACSPCRRRTSAPRGLRCGPADAASARATSTRRCEDGPLVIAWLLRGTLHLVATRGPRLAARADARRRRRPGSGGGCGSSASSPHAAERAVELVGAAVAEGPRTPGELRARLAAARASRSQDRRCPHLLGLAARRGACVLGPLRDGAPALRARAARRGRPGDPHAELARRYLAAHAPAEAADLAAWSGLPLGDGPRRPGLAGGGRARRRVRRRGFPPRLLPPTTRTCSGGATARSVAPAHASAVHPGGGILRATATADGRAVGLWTLRRGKVELQPFGPPPGARPHGARARRGGRRALPPALTPLGRGRLDDERHLREPARPLVGDDRRPGRHPPRGGGTRPSARRSARAGASGRKSGLPRRT